MNWRIMSWGFAVWYGKLLNIPPRRTNQTSSFAHQNKSFSPQIPQIPQVRCSSPFQSSPSPVQSIPIPYPTMAVAYPIPLPLPFSLPLAPLVSLRSLASTDSKHAVVTNRRAAQHSLAGAILGDQRARSLSIISNTRPAIGLLYLSISLDSGSGV